MGSNKFEFGDYIEFEIKKRFGIITLNRVHRSNAFDIHQFENLKKAVKYCQKDEKIRGVILTNNGTSFSTGVDLGAINSGDHEAVKYLEKTAATICKLLYNGKPAISAINGRTMGEVLFFLCVVIIELLQKKVFFKCLRFFLEYLLGLVV